MDQLDDVVRHLRAALGPNLLGAYLFGSGASGGLRPRSDLDVLAVVTHSLTDPEKSGLVRGLLPLSAEDEPTPSRRWLEVTVVAQQSVRPWRFPPPMELQYGEWWRSELEAGETPWKDLNPDLTIMLAMALRTNRPLYGPPLTTLLDPIPRADVVRATTATLDDLMADLGSDTRNVLLTLARAWVTVAEGSLLSKDGAADWALRRLPPKDRDLLERARVAYVEGRDDGWVDLMPRASALAERLVAEIRAATNEDPRPGDP